jgi:hypothetical protein
VVFDFGLVGALTLGQAGELLCPEYSGGQEPELEAALITVEYLNSLVQKNGRVVKSGRVIRTR